MHADQEAVQAAGLPVICRECGNDEGPYDGLCLDCLEEGAT